MSRAGLSCLVGVLLLGSGLLGPLSAGEPVFRGFEATQRVLLDQPMQPESFPDLQLAIITPAFAADGGLVNRLDCRGVQKRNGQVVRGNSMRLDPQIIDLDNGNTLADPPARSASFRPFAVRSFGFGDFSDRFPTDEVPSIGVLIDGSLTGSTPIDELRVTCAAKNRQPCRPDDDTLCLAANNRFQVEAEWSNGPVGGQAGVFRSRRREGAFFFDSPDFAELAVQILNGCNDNGHWWVFYAATTNVDYTLTVVDTQSGESKAYSNTLGQPAPAITDTAAFATCP